MPTKPPKFGITITYGGPLCDSRITDFPAEMRDNPPRLFVEQIFHVGRGTPFSIRLGALFARLFGKRVDAIRLNATEDTPARCRRIGHRVFIWD